VHLRRELDVHLQQALDRRGKKRTFGIEAKRLLHPTSFSSQDQGEARRADRTECRTPRRSS
jgi:hypothetical protein